MSKKKVPLTDAIEFARENGYIFAVYEKKDKEYVLNNECFLSDINTKGIEIEVDVIDNCINFKEFLVTDDEGLEYCFRLHNNFNLPEVIPIFDKKDRCTKCIPIKTEKCTKCNWNWDNLNSSKETRKGHCYMFQDKMDRCSQFVSIE